MSLLPVAVWGLQVSLNDGLVPAISDIPATIRITMAALDPTAKPNDPKQPLRSTLKIMRRPLQNPGFDDDDSESDESEDEEEAKQTKGKKAQKESKKDTAPAKEGKAATGDKMDVEDDDDDDEDDDEESDGEDGEYEIEEFTLCTLDTERNYQQPLDITIGEDEDCYFKVVGNFDISLTGNYIVASNDHDGYDDESGDDDDYDLSPSEDELNMYGGESESDDLDDLEDPRIQEVDTDDENGVNGTEKKTDKTTSGKTDKKAEEKKADKKAEKAEKAEKKSLKRAAEESEEAAATPEKKLSKKQLKKLKANNGKAVDASAEAKAKKVQFAKELEQGPTPSPAADKKTEKKKPEPAGKQSKVVQGITVMDSKVGTGPAAKRGNKLSLRYIGKLENGKVFDSNVKGKPFTFILGGSEVIKGWDIGLEGMQVGGERRLKVPAASAYGKKALPGIPANSTLIFDIKLIEIK